MFVREVGLNSTMFVTWDGKRMYYPNNVLSQKPIHNVRRSPNMSEKIVLNVDCYTPQSKILALRARMRDFLVRESKEFLPDMEIQIQEMDVKLKISMVIEHKGNWQDSGRRWARRTKVRKTKRLGNRTLIKVQLY
jgi:small-conductance mechanosensitive channel